MSPTVPPISVITTSWPGRGAPDGGLDLVGDVGDHLDRAAEVFAAALLGDHGLVDPPVVMLFCCESDPSMNRS